MRRNYRGTGKECVNPKPSARRVQEEQEEEINDDDVMTYDRLIVLCMSKLKIYNLKDIEMMTLREFNYRMWALEYEQLDKDMEMYKLAFAIRDAQAEQKVKGGKKGEMEYKFSNADEIIDYQANVKRLNKGEPLKFGSESKFEDNKPNKDLLQMIANFNKK
ncbi:MULTISPECIES: hypothetical protein [Staphylococcus]|uniref:hypothetical protein n=1 Tax=Staphylococcus TaxID=1279 RepID=UPI001CEF5E4A|nr:MULTISPECIES: hypothetical protein [Staphylococcus]